MASNRQQSPTKLHFHQSFQAFVNSYKSSDLKHYSSISNKTGTPPGTLYIRPVN
uniref:Uncharacterized protein n=1 Tax=Anguilla anguilla TaxID=7936 RepID=A0A0E9QTW4_ANGAN